MVEKIINLKENISNAEVGIWWWNGSEIWAISCSLDDAVEDRLYLQYSLTDNHLTLWKDIKNEHKDFPDIIDKGYKYLERGRVVYNIRAHSFEVIGSEELLKDNNFRKVCKDYFHLNGCRVEFIPDNHYHRVTTDNPTILAFEYDW